MAGQPRNVPPATADAARPRFAWLLLVSGGYEYNIAAGATLAAVSRTGVIGVKTVRQILGEKGRDTWSVDPETQVGEALASMTEHNIGAVLVMAEGNLVGILSERDFTRYVASQGRKADIAARVGDVMTPRPVCVTPAQTVDECMALMTDKRVRHLPVVEDGRVVGLVSIGDAVKATIAEQQFIIEQLEMYISS